MALVGSMDRRHRRNAHKLRAAAAPELPELVFQNPLEALPELIGDDAFLAGCAATLAVSMAAGIWSHLDWSRWLHDGTWVGGRRAPGAPIHGDARLISAHGELKRRSESRQEGKRPSGGTLVVGEIREGRQAPRLGPRLHPRRERRGQEPPRRDPVSHGQLRAGALPRDQRHQGRAQGLP